MAEIRAEYTLTTPAFIGGADQKDAELRLSSFKGALRFWWRARAWSRLLDLAAIHREEAELFGSASGGQSKVLLNLISPDELRLQSAGEMLRDSESIVGMGARYLGYGVMEAFDSSTTGKRGGQLTRGCICPSTSFTVRARLRTRDEVHIESLLDAFQILGLLGGVGSKARKGYGSVTLQSLSVDAERVFQAPADAASFESHTVRLLGAPSQSLPDYSAFCASSRVVVTNQNTPDPLVLLDLLGREMVRFRSWGHKGRVLGNIEAERNFERDHDIIKMNKDPRGRLPDRAAFGLPYNKVQPSDGRRASPLFIHVHQAEGAAPLGVITFLPALFLPPSKSNKLNVNRKQVGIGAEPFAAVTDFLNRLVDGEDSFGNERAEPFTQVREVQHG